MGYCVTCPLLYNISLWYCRKFQHDAACRQERIRRKCFHGWWWNEGEGRTWRTHGSVSEQKTWSDGRRQPIGCGRDGVVDTRDEGGVDVAGGDVWRWVGKSAVGTGISALSHRVSVQPSTTAEHTTVDSWALHAPKKKKTHTQVPSHKDATPSPLQRTQTQSSPMRTTRTSKTTETEESAPNFVSTLHCSSCSLILFYFTFLLENLAVRWMRIFIYFIFIWTGKCTLMTVSFISAKLSKVEVCQQQKNKRLTVKMIKNTKSSRSLKVKQGTYFIKKIDNLSITMKPSIEHYLLFINVGSSNV